MSNIIIAKIMFSAYWVKVSSQDMHSMPLFSLGNRSAERNK